MKKVFHVKWTNKYSNEVGYVGKLLKSKGYFVNAETIEEARKFASASQANKAIETLVEIGEAENNNFEVVVVEA